MTVLIACSGPAPPVSDPEAPSRDQVIAERVRLERWDEDVLRHSATADRARLDRTRRRIDALGVRIEAFDRTRGVRTARVEAPRGELDLSTDRGALMGGVEITDAAGRTLSTSSVTYDARSGRLVAPGAVVVRGANFEAHAPSLVFDTAGEIVEAPGPLKARVSPSVPGPDRSGE